MRRALPDEFADALTEVPGEAEPFPFEEFVERVADRQDVDTSTAETYARAVGSTLADAASDREREATAEQLPDPFVRLFESPNADA